MRRVGQVADEAQAARLVDYLLTRGIPAEAAEGDGGVDVWAVDEDRLEDARAEVAAFNAAPDDPKYAAAASAAKAAREEKLSADIAYRKQQVKVRRRFEGPRSTTLTVMLAAACCMVSLVTVFGAEQKQIVAELLISEDFKPNADGWHSRLPEVASGQVWRLFTPALMHGSPLHLLFNMMWLWQLGRLIEFRRGPVRYVALTVFLAVSSNLIQFVWAGPFFYGYSGVVCGLVGYALVFGREADPALRLNQQTTVIFLVFLVFMATARGGNIANAAHFGGLAMGLLAGGVDALLSRR